MQNLFGRAGGRLSAYLTNRQFRKQKILSGQVFDKGSLEKYPDSQRAGQFLRLEKSVGRVSEIAGTAQPKTLMLLDAKF